MPHRAHRAPRYPELAAEIARTGIPRYRIAADAEMPANTLSMIVTGRHNPSPAQRARIARVLNRSEQHLFGDNDERAAS